MPERFTSPLLQARTQLVEIRNKVSTWTIDTLAERTLTAHTKVATAPQVRERFQELVALGGVPLGYANHQSHPDGVAFAVVARHLIGLSKSQLNNRFSIPGFVVPFAVTMANGAQSKELADGYGLLKGAAEKMGALGITVTRPRDEILYEEKKDPAELLPLGRRLGRGWGMLLLPEASVQGGRHTIGGKIDEIFGIQEVRNNSLIKYFETMQWFLGKQGRFPFFLPIGLHGSYRIMQSMKGDPPKPEFTSRGKWSLRLGVLGKSLLPPIQSNILMPYTEVEIAKDLGPNWLENPAVFNDYAMRKVAPGVPMVARGIYASSA